MTPRKAFTDIMNEDKKEYFLSFTIRQFGQGLYAIFIPALLYTLGFSIRAIGIYYLCWSTGQFISNFIASKYAHEKGIRTTFAIGIPFILLFIGSTLLIEKYLWAFGISAATGGIAASLFWAPYHQYLALRTKKGNRGKTITVLWTMTSISVMIAPAVGGILMDTLGVGPTLGFVAAITLISLIPLWKVENVKTPKSCTPQEVFASHKAFKAFYAVGLTTAGAGMLWPLAFYIILQGYTLLGIITFATSLLSLIIINFVGHHHDQHENKKVLKIGSISQGATLFARLLAINSLTATIVDAADKIVQKLFWLGVDAETYKLREQDENAVIKREAYIHLGIFTLFVFLSITGSVAATFVLAGVASMFVTQL